MLQFGKEVALKVLLGAAWFFEASDRTWTGSDFASVQSPEAQRFYNYLCIAFGSDPATFKFVVDQNLLPAAPRAALQRRILRAAAAPSCRRSCRTWTMHCSRRYSRPTWLMLDEPQMTGAQPSSNRPCRSAE